MKIETYIDSLVSYAMNCGLAEPVEIYFPYLFRNCL